MSRTPPTDLFVPPSELLRRHGLQAKKQWGQNFLHDRGVVEAIVDAAGVTDQDEVIEIGAGLGALTAVLANRVAHVTAVERDRDLVKILREELANRPNLDIAEANALTYDFGSRGKPVKVLGNLPYHISSPLLFHLLDQRQHLISATLMLQRELAERLVAPPGSRVYGAPSVTCQLHTELRICLRVGRGAFVPVPKVDSAVVKLQMRREPQFETDLDLFPQVVRAAFSTRRKTVRRALASHFAPTLVAEALGQAQVDPRLRAEALSVADFARLTLALATADS